ncbi:MFS transporter [Chitinophaga solisilvae]|uniref:MFS transporter n=1 Tax=Chitinophaga solisilvae TaxID=1233460 RepID=UPI00136A45E6|nr:MFS transporter [Chitinophaga solisilvae]
MKRLAYIGCLGLIGIITTEFGIIGILPQVAAHYKISIDMAGMLLSAFALVIAFTGPLLTLLASGFERRRVMALSMFLFFVSCIFSAMAPPFWLLVILRILPAFLQPVYISSAIAAAVKAADKKDEHKMMAIILGGISIATVTTVPLSTWLASVLSWQSAFVMQAAVSLLALVSIWWLPEMPAGEKKSYGAQLGILTRPDFLMTALIAFLMISAWFSSYSYFADYLGKVKHMNEATVSKMMLLFGITGVVGNWVAGKILGRSLAVTTAIFLVGTLLIPVLLNYSGGDTILTVTVIALWGFLYAPCFLTATATMISGAPDALAFANSLAISFGNLGVSVGTAVSGMVIASQSVAVAPWVGMLFGAAALLAILLRSVLQARWAKAACVAQ